MLDHNGADLARSLHRLLVIASMEPNGFAAPAAPRAPPATQAGADGDGDGEQDEGDQEDGNDADEGAAGPAVAQRDAFGPYRVQVVQQVISAQRGGNNNKGKNTAADRRNRQAAEWTLLEYVGKKKTRENIFLVRFARPVFDNSGQGNAASVSGDNGDEESSSFMLELRDRVDLEHFDREARKRLMPGLWTHCRGSSLEHFNRELHCDRATADRYPLLSGFLANEPQFRSLRHLSEVIAFPSLLFARYNRRLDRRAARSLLIRDVLNQVSASERDTWMNAFRGFAAACNASWRFVERFGCLRIPAEYANITMDASTPVSFCLPDEHDEGVCPLALLQWLTERHNECIHLAGTLPAMTRVLEPVSISSRLVNASHCIVYDMQQTIVPYFADRTVEVTDGGETVFDFERAEAFILGLLVSKPLVNLEIRIFNYLNEASTGTLRAKITQEVIPHDIAGDIARDLRSPAEAQICLELVLVGIAFLNGTGGAIVGKLSEEVANTLLADYLQNVLLMRDVRLSSRSVSSHIRLKHLSALKDLLEELTDNDPFRRISSRYKQQLSSEEVRQVRDMAADIDLAVLMPVFKEFVVSQLGEEHLAADTTLAAVLGYLETPSGSLLNELTWFNNGFRSELKLKHAVAIYRELANI